MKDSAISTSHFLKHLERFASTAGRLSGAVPLLDTAAIIFRRHRAWSSSASSSCCAVESVEEGPMRTGVDRTLQELKHHQRQAADVPYPKVSVLQQFLERVVSRLKSSLFTFFCFRLVFFFLLWKRKKKWIMFKSSPEPLLLEGGRAKKYHFEESRWSSDPWAAALLCPSVRRAPFTTPVWGRFIQHRACGTLFAARTPAHCGSARSLARTGCWTPLDRKSPKKRLQELVKQMKPSVVLCDDDSPFKQLEVPVVHAKLSFKVFDRPMVHFEESMDKVAQVIYTSGSTGAPKGVMYTHGRLAHSTHFFAQQCEVRPWLPGFAEDSQHLVCVSPWSLSGTLQRRTYRPPRPPSG